MLADQCVIVAGEFKTKRIEDFHAVRESAETLVWQVLYDTGYSSAATGIAPDNCEIQIRFNGQSQDTAALTTSADANPATIKLTSA